MIKNSHSKPQWTLLFILSLLCLALCFIDFETSDKSKGLFFSISRLGVPLIVSMRLCHLNINVEISKLRTYSRLVTSILYGYGIYKLTYILSPSLYGKFMGYQLHLNGRWFDDLYAFTDLTSSYMIPLGTYLMLKVFKHSLSLKGLLQSFFLTLGLTILAPAIFISLTDSRDFDHNQTFEYSLLIVLWLLSIGLLFVKTRGHILELYKLGLNLLTSVLLSFGGLGVFRSIADSISSSEPIFHHLLSFSPYLYIQSHLPYFIIGLTLFSILKYSSLILKWLFIDCITYNLIYLLFPLGGSLPHGSPFVEVSIYYLSFLSLITVLIIWRLKRSKTQRYI